METKKSAGIIIYKTINQEKFYLLLKHPNSDKESSWWSFPKGTMENKETPLETAKRELFEETGIAEQYIKINSNFEESINYFFKKEDVTFLKTVVFFLAETKKESVKLSFEHQDFCWLSFSDAFNKLNYKELKEVLSKADRFILFL